MPAPPDPNLCPGHAALETMIQDMKEQRKEDREAQDKQREEDRSEIKGYIDGAVTSIKDSFLENTQRIEKRLDKGDQKFQQHNGEIVVLKGRDRYLTGGLALLIFLTPIVISLIALFWK